MVIMASKEAIMYQSCSKCNKELDEFKTNITIATGLLSQKRAYAMVCEDCGRVEFHMR